MGLEVFRGGVLVWPPVSRARGGIKIKNVPLALAAIALGMGAVMAKDTYEGTQQKTDVKVAQVKQQLAVDDMFYDFGRGTENPMMNRWAHKLHEWSHYGPGDLWVRLAEIKIKVGRFMDAITQNIIPLGIGLGALYVGLGPERVARGLGKAWDFMARKLSEQTGLMHDVLRITKSVFRPIGSGIHRLASWPFDSGTNFFVAAFALLAGSFALNKFRDVYTGDASQQSMRDEFNIKEIVGH